MEESRIDQAVSLFMEGYNCAQSVFAAYADLFGFDRETALKMSSPFGAGLGRMREVCGAVSGMAMVAGLTEGNAAATDKAAQTHIYELTRQMSDAFRTEEGSILCREILGLKAKEESPRPSERTAAYYAKRPCVSCVECAARIIEQTLIEKRDAT